MHEAYTQMISCLPQVFHHGDDINQPRLVIAIDEAHPLKELQTHFQPAHILCRAISLYSFSGLECLYLGRLRVNHFEGR